MLIAFRSKKTVSFYVISQFKAKKYKNLLVLKTDDTWMVGQYITKKSHVI